MSAELDAALMFAGRGAPVFRVNPRTNHPLLRSAHPTGDPLRGVCKGECGKLGHGFHDATTDPDVIRDWWTQHPTAAIGARTGIAFDVLDVDHEGFGEGVADLPDCETNGGPIVQSGGGKWHLYFAPTGLGRMIRFSRWCDWLGTDGYVIVPPSGHKDGGNYSWFAPFDLELHAPPAELLAALRRPVAPVPFGTGASFDPPGQIDPPVSNETGARPRIDSPTRARSGYSAAGLIGQVAAAIEGERNATLVWAAHRVGLDVRSGRATRSEGDQACQALEGVALLVGLTEAETRKTITSGYSAGLAGRTGKGVAA